MPLSTGGSPAPVRLWDVGQKTELAQFPVDGSVISLAFDPATDQFALTAGGTTIQIWDIADAEVGAKKGDAYRLDCPNACPSVRMEKPLPPVTYDYSVRLWDIESGGERVRLIGHTTVPRCAGFQPRWGDARFWKEQDGPYLECGTRNRVRPF